MKSVHLFFASSLNYREDCQFFYFSCFKIDDAGDISPPHAIKVALEMEAEAELERCVQIYESKGAVRCQAIFAKGEARANLAISEATAHGIGLISEALAANEGTQAANLIVAEECIRAFSDVANTGKTIILPSNVGNPAALMIHALKIYEKIQSNVQQQDRKGPSLGGIRRDWSCCRMPLLIQETDSGKTLLKLNKHWVA